MSPIIIIKVECFQLVFSKITDNGKMKKDYDLRIGGIYEMP